VEAHVGGGTSDAPVGGLGYWWQTKYVDVGALAAATWARNVYSAGLLAPSLARVRGRMPVSVHVATSRRARLSLFVAPGAHAFMGAQPSTAITLDSGAVATVLPIDAVSVSAGLTLPVAFDVDPRFETSRFPGVNWGLSSFWRIRPRYSVGVSGTLSIPEGYGGDIQKYAVEGWLSFRFHLGNAPFSPDGLPILVSGT